MNRAEWRRKKRDEEKKKKSNPPLASNVRPKFLMTQAQLDNVKAQVTDDVINHFGGIDKAAIELAKKQGIDEGYDEGFNFARDHFFTLQYICMGLAMHRRFKFAAKRIMDIWNLTNDIYSKIVDRMNAGEDLDVLETEYNWRLFNETGLKLDMDGYGE